MENQTKSLFISLYITQLYFELNVCSSALFYIFLLLCLLMCVCNVCLPETLQTQIDNLEKSRLKQLHIVEARKATSEESNAQGLSSKTVSPLESCLLSPFILFSRKFSYSAQHTSDTGACDIVISFMWTIILCFVFMWLCRLKSVRKLHMQMPLMKKSSATQGTGRAGTEPRPSHLSMQHSCSFLITSPCIIYANYRRVHQKCCGIIFPIYLFTWWFGKVATLIL